MELFISNLETGIFWLGQIIYDSKSSISKCYHIGMHLAPIFVDFYPIVAKYGFSDPLEKKSKWFYTEQFCSQWSRYIP